MRKTLYSWLAAMLLFSVNLSAQTYLGYSNETIKSGNTYRYGTDKPQGMAIRLSAEKVALLKGHTISALRAVFGSKNSTNNAATLFITHELGGTPLATQDITLVNSSVNKWKEYALDKPYTIQGDEGDLYIGCTLEISATYGPFVADFTQDAQGISYALGTDGWVDMYGKGYGMPLMEAVISDNMTLTDVLLKDYQSEGYLQQGKPANGQLQLVNIGTTTITSFDMQVQFGNAAPQTISVTANLAPHATQDIDLSQLTVDAKGQATLTASVTGIEDADLSDNQTVSQQYIYPASTEKSVLVELFTSQHCTNCSQGHSSVENAMAQSGTSCIMVAHHSGYYYDFYSTTADAQLASLWGLSYNPAMTANRTIVDGASPCFECWSTSTDLSAIQTVDKVRPYVSFDMASTYDPETRQVDLDVNVYTHETLPGADNRLTLYLVQDSLVSYQSGASGTLYTHNDVTRMCLTEGSFGEALAFEAGKTTNFHKQFTLPETIVSDYYDGTDGNGNIPVVANKMRIVALVHNFSTKDLAQNQVYNCAEVALEGHTTQGGFPEPQKTERLMKRQTWYGDTQGYESDDVAVRTIDYLYDNQNRLVRAVETSKGTNIDEWQLTHYYLYQYNAQGLIAQSNSLQYGQFNYGDLAYQPAKDTITYEYNDANQLIRENRPLKYLLYQYDAEGHRIQRSTWNINSISGVAKNDLVEDFSDFNAQGNPQKVTASSPTGKSWNEYTGTYTYDADGNLIAEQHYVTEDGVTKKSYAEYWTYENGILRVHSLPYVWDDGTEVESAKTVYTPVDGNTNMIKHIDYTGAGDNWDVNAGSTCIDEYDYYTTGGEEPTLTATLVDELLNSVKLEVTIPEGATTATLYRSGQKIEMPVDELRNGYLDESLLNGTYEYIVQFDNGVCSNLAVAQPHVDLPAVTNLHLVQTRKDFSGNNYITIGFTNPERDEALGFIRNDLYFINMQQADATTEDGTVTELEGNLTVLTDGVLYVQSVYKYGRVNSAYITITNLEDGVTSIKSEGATRLYDLQGRSVQHPTRRGIYVSKDKKYLKK